MKTKALILASAALFALGIGSANSGPCTAEIEGLAKTLATKDAGSGPTPGASGRTQSPGGPLNQHPPAAAMSQATQSQTAPALAGQHPPTAAMSEATHSQAAPRPSASGQNTSEASIALNRARTLDQQGNESECMEAVRQARQLAGP